MQLIIPERHQFDPGRVLNEDDRRELEQEYTRPRPEQKVCRRISPLDYMHNWRKW